MQERWKNVVLDTPEKAAGFCDAYYAEVYDRVWELTGDADQAAVLTERVLEQVRISFRTRGLPGDPMRYLGSLIARMAGDSAHPEAAQAVPMPPQPEYTDALVPYDTEREPEKAHPLRAQTQFDGDKTSLWLPGERFDHQDLEDARQASRARPKETGNQRSVKLSIFNSMLFITALLAAAYVLYQVGIMMDIL